MDEHPKDCPFCGSPGIVGDFMVGCGKCKLGFVFDPRVPPLRTEAISNWNRRANAVP